ncbi:MAG: DUF58 domain-containing protein [Desulfobacterales bacterium]|nr:DUF58 domain-containing protein [Desulfobacterales bacterium]
MTQKTKPEKYKVTLPYTLNRKKIYILPTRHGFLFILVLTGMLLGSVNYNNNLGFLLTFLLGGMAFVSILHTFKNLSGIQIISVITKPVFANEKPVFDFLVRSDAHVRASVLFKFVKNEETRENLYSDRDNQISVMGDQGQRGIYRPGILTVSTMYPLGLFRSWSKFYIDAECLVYPVPRPGPFVPANISSSKDDNETEEESGPGADDFQGLRLYQPGDSLRRISWKAFSRGQGLFIKDFTGNVGSSVLLDWHSLNYSDTEQKLSRLCDMVLKANSLKLEYGLNLPGKNIVPDKGEFHKHKCLKTLALFDS